MSACPKSLWETLKSKYPGISLEQAHTYLMKQYSGSRLEQARMTLAGKYSGMTLDQAHAYLMKQYSGSRLEQARITLADKYSGMTLDQARIALTEKYSSSRLEQARMSLADKYSGVTVGQVCDSLAEMYPRSRIEQARSSFSETYAQCNWKQAQEYLTKHGWEWPRRTLPSAAPEPTYANAKWASQCATMSNVHDLAFNMEERIGCAFGARKLKIEPLMISVWIRRQIKFRQ